MVAAKQDTAIATAVSDRKPAVVLAEGLARWIPAGPGELRVYRKNPAATPDGVALCRAYLQGVIDAHPTGEAEGCGEIEDFADATAKRFPLTGDPRTDSVRRTRAREIVAAFADAWCVAIEEAYYRGREDEREGR